MVISGGALISKRSLPQRQPPVQGRFQSSMMSCPRLIGKIPVIASGAKQSRVPCTALDCHGPAAPAMTSLGQGISRRLFFRCPTRPLFAISEAGMHRGRADMRFRVKFGTFLRGIVLAATRSEEHTSELQSLMRISYAVSCLKKKKKKKKNK